MIPTDPRIAPLVRDLAARAVANGFFAGIDIPPLERAGDYSMPDADQDIAIARLGLTRPPGLAYDAEFLATMCALESAVVDALRDAVRRGCITVTLEVPQ